MHEATKQYLYLQPSTSNTGTAFALVIAIGTAVAHL